MKFWLFRPLLLLAAFVAPVSTSLAQADLPKDKWIVDWGEQRCSLVRKSSGGEGLTMVLRASLGTHRPELVLSKEKGKPLPSIDVDVELMLVPIGAPVSSFGYALKSEDGKRLFLIENLSDDFFDQFANSRELLVRRKGRELVRIQYTNAQAAIRNIRSGPINRIPTAAGMDSSLRQQEHGFERVLVE